MVEIEGEQENLNYFSSNMTILVDMIKLIRMQIVCETSVSINIRKIQ